jgi:metal-dependent HD superfamily phosphatase/phosphodiesterase
MCRRNWAAKERKPLQAAVYNHHGKAVLQIPLSTAMAIAILLIEIGVEDYDGNDCRTCSSTKGS